MALQTAHPLRFLCSDSSCPQRKRGFWIHQPPHRHCAHPCLPPAANLNGTDRFTSTVKDSAQGSTPATASIAVTPMNDLSTASGTMLSSEAYAHNVAGNCIRSIAADGTRYFTTTYQYDAHGRAIHCTVRQLTGVAGHQT